MKLLSLSAMGVTYLTSEELVNVNGGTAKEAYNAGHAVGEQIRKALESALFILAPWLK
jgi:hypothetical protein